MLGETSETVGAGVAEMVRGRIAAAAEAFVSTTSAVKE
jgi:hypothetical protein